jgi:hypothetical protein
LVAGEQAVKGGGTPGDTADLVFDSEARVWINIRHGRLTLRDAMKQKLVRTTGAKTALANFHASSRSAEPRRYQNASMCFAVSTKCRSRAILPSTSKVPRWISSSR